MPAKVKKSSKKSIETYSSKFVCEVIDSIIQDKIQKVTKNAKTTEKWLAKMKSSVLRKISASTKTAYMTPGI